MVAYRNNTKQLVTNINDAVTQLPRAQNVASYGIKNIAPRLPSYVCLSKSLIVFQHL